MESRILYVATLNILAGVITGGVLYGDVGTNRSGVYIGQAAMATSEHKQDCNVFQPDSLKTSTPQEQIAQLETRGYPLALTCGEQRVILAVAV